MQPDYTLASSWASRVSGWLELWQGAPPGPAERDTAGLLRCAGQVLAEQHAANLSFREHAKLASCHPYIHDAESGRPCWAAT